MRCQQLTDAATPSPLRRSPRALLVGLCAAVLALGACADDDDGPPAEPGVQGEGTVPVPVPGPAPPPGEDE
jgi:hypothetical protein